MDSIHDDKLEGEGKMVSLEWAAEGKMVSLEYSRRACRFRETARYGMGTPHCGTE